MIRRGAGLFAGTPVPVEIRNEARVHLWYGARFGLRLDAGGRPQVHALHGYDDLFGMVVRPNPGSPAPRHLYEAKAARWRQEWTQLTVLPWESGRGHVR